MLNRIFNYKGKKEKPEEKVDEAKFIKESKIGREEVVEIFEHERWREKIGWSSRNLDVGDPQRYLHKDGQSDNFVYPDLQPGWVFSGPW